MQAALGHAETLISGEGEGIEPADPGPAVEARVLIREELRHIPLLALRLSEDQRRILLSQIRGESCHDFCAREQWSREKYRKVAQRARTRLRALLDEVDLTRD
jgi:DNA-directed RNA polymerase specialized sigma24 family protein